MGQYTNKGLYNKYDKNHKERNKLDYLCNSNSRSNQYS